MNNGGSGFRLSVACALVALAAVAVSLPARAYAPLPGSNPVSAPPCAGSCETACAETADNCPSEADNAISPPRDIDADAGAEHPLASDAGAPHKQAYDSFNMTADASVPGPGIAEHL